MMHATMPEPGEQVPLIGGPLLEFVQFGIGIGVNLYTEVPKNRTFLPAVFSSTALAAHAIVAVVPSCSTSVGLAAILVAASAASSFGGNGSNGASLTMALATAVAIRLSLVGGPGPQLAQLLPLVLVGGIPGPDIPGSREAASRQGEASPGDQALDIGPVDLVDVGVPTPLLLQPEILPMNLFFVHDLPDIRR